MNTELTTIDQVQAITTGSRQLDQNPAAVYLATLASATGRRTQRQALDTMAGMLSNGAVDCLAFPWAQLRYQHTAAIRAQLMARYKAATVNKFLSALRGVLKQAWLLHQLPAEEYQRAVTLDAVTGETIPAGRELTPGELAALLATCETDLTPAGARDAAIIAVMYAAGLRREEVTGLDLESYDPGSGRLVVLGKRNKERKLHIQNGALANLRDWLAIRGSEPGPLFYAINRGGNVQAGHGLTPTSVHDLSLIHISEPTRPY